MARKKIVFDEGPSIEDLGISNNGNAISASSINGSADDIVTSFGNTNKGIDSRPITGFGSSTSGTSVSSNAVCGNTAIFNMIREYLNRALGDSPRAEIKLSSMQKELGINPKTLYKHLRVLRETDFTITKLQYGTEIKRKEL